MKTKIYIITILWSLTSTVGLTAIGTFMFNFTNLQTIILLIALGLVNFYGLSTILRLTNSYH